VKTLHLTLHREWFDLILSGEKTEEYREVKEYWRRRLEGQKYDQIIFRNGYSKAARWMRVSCLEISRGIWRGQPVFVLRLGVIFEAGNL
jgi:ASC-1-like (ASCH) protein